MPLVDLLPPKKVQVVLIMIGEELKSCKFFTALRELGLDDAFYQTDLSTYILTQAGFDAESDAVLGRYFRLLSKHSEQLDTKPESVRECAFRFYMELVS